MKYFDLFVSLTVLPVWRRPPRTPREARVRAALAAEFLAASDRLAAELKKGIIGRMADKQAGGNP